MVFFFFGLVAAAMLIHVALWYFHKPAVTIPAKKIGKKKMRKLQEKEARKQADLNIGRADG